MSVASKLERFPSLFFTHLKANWKRGIVIVLGLFTIVLILNEALITASSIAMYSVTRPIPEGAVAPESALIFDMQGLNPAYFGNGFPRDLNQIRNDLNDFMIEAISRANLKIASPINTHLMLDARLYAWMKDLTNNSNIDDTFLQLRVIGLDDELLAQMGFSTTGGTLVVLDRISVDLVPLTPEERDRYEDDPFLVFPKNETMYRVDGDEYSNYGVTFPYSNFHAENTTFVYDSWIGEFYGEVLKDYIKENDTLVLRSAPSKRPSSLVSSLSLNAIHYYQIPRIATSVAASVFYESSSILASLVGFSLISYYAEDQGAFIFVPISYLYSVLDAYFRTYEFDASPYNSTSSFPFYLMPLSRLYALYDFNIDLGYYSNHLEELPPSWYRVEQILEQDGIIYLDSLIPEQAPPDPKNPDYPPKFFFEGGVSASLYSPYSLSTRVSGVVTSFFVVLFYLLILGLPVIILAIFAGNFATNLAMHGLYRQISIYRVRGMLSLQVFLLLIAEVLLMVTLGTIMSFIGAIPLTMLILSSRGILVFDFNPIHLVLPLEWLSRVVIVGLVLGFLLRIRTVFRLSRTSIRQTGVLPFEGEPYWKRKNLDFIALAWGIIGILFFTNLRSIFQFQLPGMLVLLLGLLFIPSPVILLVGAILFLSRFVPLLLQLLKKLAEKMDIGLPVLVLRDLAMRRHVVARAILLIAFGMATAALITGFPVNMLHHDQRFVYYNTGADFMIPHQVNPQFKQVLLANLSDFDVRVTEWQLVTFNTGFSLKNTSSARITLLGINSSTFAEAAYFENSFGLSRLGLQGALQKLQEDPLGTALVSTRSKDLLELTIPGTLQFQSLNPYPFNNTNITLVDEFAFWPRLIDYFRSPFAEDDIYYGDEGIQKELVLVMDLQFTLLVTNQSSLSGQYTVNEGYYLKVHGDDTIKDQVAYRLNNLQIFYTAVHTSLLTKNEDFSRVFFSMNNAFLVIVLAVVSLVIVLLAVIYQRERWRDMGVERTLGMSKKQLYAYNILSTVIMSVVGIVIGITMGLSLMYIFLSIIVTVLSSMVPPLEIVMPTAEILIFLVFSSAFIVIGAALAVYLSSRRSISNILKVE